MSKYFSEHRPLLPGTPTPFLLTPGLSSEQRRVAIFLPRRRASILPFRFKPRARRKRFLRPHLHGGQTRVEVRARQRLALRQALAEKYREAADESITGPGGVERRHRKRSKKLRGLLRHQQRTAATQRQNHARKSFLQQRHRAQLGFFHGVHRQASNSFGFAFVG